MFNTQNYYKLAEIFYETSSMKGKSPWNYYHKKKKNVNPSLWDIG